MTTDPVADQGAPPTRATVRELVGPAAPWWDRLCERVETMGARGSFTWDGPKYGWSVKYSRAGRPLVTLSPSEGGFKALVILGGAQVEEFPALPLGPHVRGIFEAARQYPDGRWLLIPVESPADVADILTILATKLPPTIRAKVAAAR